MKVVRILSLCFSLRYNLRESKIFLASLTLLTNPVNISKKCKNHVYFATKDQNENCLLLFQFVKSLYIMNILRELISKVVKNDSG